MDANDEHERLETRRNASRVFFFTMTLRVRLPPPHQRTRTRTDGDGDGDTKGWGWEHERGPNDETKFRRLCPRLETRLEPGMFFFYYLITFY